MVWETNGRSMTYNRKVRRIEFDENDETVLDQDTGFINSLYKASVYHPHRISMSQATVYLVTGSNRGIGMVNLHVLYYENPERRTV